MSYTPITVTTGTLTANAGTTGVEVSGSESSSMLLRGTVAQINALLSGSGGATLGFMHPDDEPPASVALTLTVDDLGNSGPGGARSATVSAVIAITPVEDGPPTITVTRGPIEEGNATATFTVTLSHASSVETTVAWRTVDRTARAGSDYVAASGVVTFAPGETSSQPITIALLSDDRDEDDESFVLEFSNPIGIELTSDEVEAVIIDDDASPTLSIASTSADEAAGFVEFTVTLSAASDRVVFVDWTTQSGTAGANDFVAVNGRTAFAAGETSRTIVVQLVNDQTYEATKTFQVQLTDPVNTTIVGSSSATATITSDDALPQIRVEDVVVSEATGSAQLRITLSNPSESTVTAVWNVVSGFTGFETLLSQLSGTVTFAAGQVEQLAAITFADDAIAENDRTFVVELTDLSGATLPPSASGTTTIGCESPLRIKTSSSPPESSSSKSSSVHRPWKK